MSSSGVGDAAAEAHVTALHTIRDNVLASSCAGFVARMICHPIDTIKSRIQAPLVKVAEFDGVQKALCTTLSEEGMAGLYRGVGAVLLGGIPATCIYLTTYELSKNTLGKFDFFKGSHFLPYFFSGMFAETVSCLVFVPVDVVKERLQIQRKVVAATGNKPNANSRVTNYSGSLHALQRIFTEEGVRGVYRGYGATLFSFGPFSALYFVFYEELKYFISKKAGFLHQDATIPFLWTLACSSTAGAAAAVITNPLDLIKLRLQISRSGNRESTSTIYSIFRSSLENGGVVGLFRGAGARVAFHGPNVALTMTAYEFCKGKMRAVNNTSQAS